MTTTTTTTATATTAAPYGGARVDAGGRARARVPGRGPRTYGRRRTAARGRMVR